MPEKTTSAVFEIQRINKSYCIVTEEIALESDKIISALIGLVGACGNNPKTANTDHLVCKTLAFSFSRSDDTIATQEIINEIRAEKNIIAPGCAHCASPCGNTSDYDMSRIYNADDEIRKVKFDLLSELCETASYICSNQMTDLLSETEIEFFYKALAYISYDMDKEILSEILEKAQNIKKKIKGH